VALRDIRAFDAWSAHADSIDGEWRAVRHWISGLATASYQAPSIPVPELSEQPTYEVREAIVPGSGGVYVLYRSFYGEADLVDLIAVGSFFADDSP
jgi:hypothetical protein